MGRSNAAARKRNNRMNRRVKGESRQSVAIRTIPRVEAESLIIPDGQCRRNPRFPKAIFRTEEKAAKALRQAQQMRARSGSAHVEKRYYACLESEGGCGGFHLTSRDTYTPGAWKRNSNQEAS